MIEPKIRLYSRQPRGPVDEVAPEHRVAHAEFERWGAWNRERYQQGFCYSAEHSFEETGGREARAPVISLPPDPRLRLIEQAVSSMLRDGVLEPYGETLREYYCKRWAPKTVCWAHALKYEGFGRWMYLCRQTALSLLNPIGHAATRQTHAR